MVTLEDLDRLKAALHPSMKMDVVQQCQIIYEVLLPDGLYPNDIGKVARHLDVSRNKVYKMKMIYRNCIPEMKEWLKGTGYQSDKAYRLSILKSEDQLSFTKLTDEDKMRFFKLMNEPPEPVEAPEPVDLKQLEEKFMQPAVAPETEKVI